MNLFVANLGPRAVGEGLAPSRPFRMYRAVETDTYRRDDENRTIDMRGASDKPSRQKYDSVPTVAATLTKRAGARPAPAARRDVPGESERASNFLSNCKKKPEG
jgi:hypothetical protein